MRMFFPSPPMVSCHGPSTALMWKDGSSSAACTRFLAPAFTLGQAAVIALLALSKLIAKAVSQPYVSASLVVADPLRGVGTLARCVISSVFMVPPLSWALRGGKGKIAGHEHGFTHARRRRGEDLGVLGPVDDLRQ